MYIRHNYQRYPLYKIDVISTDNNKYTYYFKVVYTREVIIFEAEYLKPSKLFEIPLINYLKFLEANIRVKENGQGNTSIFILYNNPHIEEALHMRSNDGIYFVDRQEYIKLLKKMKSIILQELT